MTPKSYLGWLLQKDLREWCVFVVCALGLWVSVCFLSQKKFCLLWFSIDFISSLNFIFSPSQTRRWCKLGCAELSRQKGETLSRNGARPGQCRRGSSISANVDSFGRLLLDHCYDRTLSPVVARSWFGAGCPWRITASSAVRSWRKQGLQSRQRQITCQTRPCTCAAFACLLGCCRSLTLTDRAEGVDAQGCQWSALQFFGRPVCDDAAGLRHTHSMGDGFEESAADMLLYALLIAPQGALRPPPGAGRNLVVELQDFLFPPKFGGSRSIPVVGIGHAARCIEPRRAASRTNVAHAGAPRSAAANSDDARMAEAAPRRIARRALC